MAAERALLALALVAGCAAPAVGPDEGVPANDALGMSMSTLEVTGIPSSFDRDHLMDDSFFEAKDWVTTEEIQRFLERTVWERPSWLARETVVLVNEMPRGPVPVSEAIVRTAQAHRINPVLLLARLQVEKSLVSPSTPPAPSVQSFGLGCKITAPRVAGLDTQLECAAVTLANQLAKARASQNNFVIKKDATTEDGIKVRPAEAATSALYAYTPVEGTRSKNGNWLAWKITRRFASAIQAAR